MTLDNLFDPSSVAVVGASPDSWYSSRLVDNLLEYGYDGELYLVNPSRKEAWGRDCYDSVAELPTTPNLVVVSVPREYVPEVLRDAGERGVGAALVVSAGFGEADDEGAELEDEVARIANETGIRVCGPNCIGVADAHTETVLTSTCDRKPEPGGMALVSQSGALAFTTFYERGTDEGVRFARIVSTGNEADLTVADFVEDAGRDEKVDVVCCYIEGTDEPREFGRAASEATKNGTPVLAVKTGRSYEGRRAAVSHTGALTGEDDAWDALFRQTGVERVPDIPDLLGRARAQAAYPEPAGRNVCVASTSGGLASLLADHLSERGLELPSLVDDTEEALRGIDGLLDYGGFENPVDIRGYGADHLPEIADALLDDEAYDLYVFGIGLSAVDERAERIADDLSSIVEEADAPVFVVWTGRKEKEADDTLPYERLRDGDGDSEGIPVYYDPGRCADAVRSLVAFAESKPSVFDSDSVGWAEEPTADGDSLSWNEATNLLHEHGIDTVETHAAETAEECTDAAEKLGRNVVVKTASSDVPHRVEAGGVVTDVEPRKAADAYEKVVSNLRRLEASEPGRVLVQPQVDGCEVLVGVSSAECFGNVVTVGTGGSYAEVIDDTAVLVPPFDTEDARRALNETAVGGKILENDASAETVVGLLEKVGEVALDERVTEVDLNPVVVTEEGYEVVDVLVVGDV